MAKFISLGVIDDGDIDGARYINIDAIAYYETITKDGERIAKVRLADGTTFEVLGDRASELNFELGKHYVDRDQVGHTG